jgi:hypothetical protein
MATTLRKFFISYTRRNESSEKARTINLKAMRPGAMQHEASGILFISRIKT